MLYLVSPNFSCNGQLFVLSTRRIASYCPSVVCIVMLLSVISVFCSGFLLFSSSISTLLSCIISSVGSLMRCFSLFRIFGFHRRFFFFAWWLGFSWALLPVVGSLLVFPCILSQCGCSFIDRFRLCNGDSVWYVLFFCATACSFSLFMLFVFFLCFLLPVCAALSFVLVCRRL